MEIVWHDAVERASVRQIRSAGVHEPAIDLLEPCPRGWFEVDFTMPVIRHGIVGPPRPIALLYLSRSFRVSTELLKFHRRPQFGGHQTRHWLNRDVYHIDQRAALGSRLKRLNQNAAPLAIASRRRPRADPGRRKHRSLYGLSPPLTWGRAGHKETPTRPST